MQELCWTPSTSVSGPRITPRTPALPSFSLRTNWARSASKEHCILRPAPPPELHPTTLAALLPEWLGILTHLYPASSTAPDQGLTCMQMERHQRAGAALCKDTDLCTPEEGQGRQCLMTSSICIMLTPESQRWTCQPSQQSVVSCLQRCYRTTTLCVCRAQYMP